MLQTQTNSWRIPPHTHITSSLSHVTLPTRTQTVSVPHVVVALWPTDSPLDPSAHSHHLISLARRSADENAVRECPARRRRSVANRLATVSLRTLTPPHLTRTSLCRRERSA